ncbi:hypothetical protein ACWGLE_18405 [Streptomyces sp. NPDC055897]
MGALAYMESILHGDRAGHLLPAAAHAASHRPLQRAYPMSKRHALMERACRPGLGVRRPCRWRRGA